MNKKDLIAVLAISATVLLVYLRAIGFGLTYLDDDTFIRSNSHMNSQLTSIGKAFTSDVMYRTSSGAFYRPVFTLSFISDALLFGTDENLYHMTNVLIHLAVCILLYFALYSSGFPALLSLLGSMLFAVHPAISMAVYWIPGRNDMLLALFFLAAFISLKRLEGSDSRRALFSFVLFTAALPFTKESGLIPFCYLAWPVLVNRSKGFSSTARSAAAVSLIAAAALYFAARTAVLPPSTDIRSILSIVFSSMAFNAPSVLVFFGKAFFPVNLSALPTSADSSLIYGLVAAVCLAAVTRYFGIRDKRSFILGLSFFLLMLLPSLFISPGSMPLDLMEQRLYLPIIGLLAAILSVGPFQEKLLDSKFALPVIAAVLLIFTAINITASHRFSDRMSFWQDAAANSPAYAKAQVNLGMAYQFEGRHEDAERYYLKTIALDPYHPTVHNNLGSVYLHKGLLSLAEKEFRTELTYNPGYQYSIRGLAEIARRKVLIK